MCKCKNHSSKNRKLSKVYVPKCRHCEMDQQRNKICCYKLNSVCNKIPKIKNELVYYRGGYFFFFYILNKYKMFLLVNK